MTDQWTLIAKHIRPQTFLSFEQGQQDVRNNSVNTLIQEATFNDLEKLKANTSKSDQTWLWC